MTLVEILIQLVGPSVARLILSRWLQSDRVSDISYPLMEIIKEKTHDIAAQQEASRLFEKIGEDVAKSLEPLFSRELNENSRQAVALAVADTFNQVVVDTKVLASQDLDPQKLATLFFSGYPQAINDFSDSEIELYRRIIIDASENIVDVSSRLPQFSESMFGEILKRDNFLIKTSGAILSKVESISKPEIKYFITLDEFLDSPGPRFPKRVDFESDLVFESETHPEAVLEKLQNSGACLVIGRSAAGKSVLSISTAKRLIEEHGYQVFYLDTSRAQAGDGRAWFQHILGEGNLSSHEKRLYIFDNCHVATKEINEFYFQYSSTKIYDCEIMFVARPPTYDITNLGDRDDFYGALSSVVVEINPEEIYWGVISKYANKFIAEDPRRFIALEQDDKLSLLKQHGHNLIVSRSRVEAWYDSGGRLSEVGLQDVYRRLARKFSMYNNEAFMALCALWQFEISANNTFIQTRLDKGDIQGLKDAHILQESFVEGYGLSYQINLHPDEAKEIFAALIFAINGRISDNLVNERVLQYLKKYLLSSPQNYVAVFDRCFQHGRKDFEVALLNDKEIQETCAAQFIESRTSDVAKFLFNLVKMDRPKAMELFANYMRQIGIKGFSDKLFASNLHDIQFTLNYFQRIDFMITKNILEAVDFDILARKAENENLQTITWAVRTLSRFLNDQALIFVRKINNLTRHFEGTDYFSMSLLIGYLEEIKFPESDIRNFVDLIDINRLLINIREETQQNLLAVIPKINKYSSAKFIDFAEEALNEYIKHPPYISWLLSIEIISYLCRNHFYITGLKKAIRLIDMHLLVIHFEGNRIYQSERFLRGLCAISPHLLEKLVANITPERFIQILDKRFSIRIFALLAKTGEEYKLPAVRLISNLINNDDIYKLLEKSNIKNIGQFFAAQYKNYNTAFDLFADKLLAQKYISVSLRGPTALAEISNFVHSLAQIPEAGVRLGRRSLDVLLEKSIFADVIKNTKLIGAKSLAIVIEMVSYDSVAIQKILDIDPVNGIRILLVLKNQNRVIRSLRARDLMANIDEADVFDLPYFMRGIYKLDHVIYLKCLDSIKNIEWEQHVVSHRQSSVADLFLTVVELGVTDDIIESIRSKIIDGLTKVTEITREDVYLRGALVAIKENSIDDMPPATSINIPVEDFRFGIWKLIQNKKAHVLSIYILGLKTMGIDGYNLARNGLELWNSSGALSYYLDDIVNSNSEYHIFWEPIVMRALTWLQQLLFDETMEEIAQLHKTINTKTFS